MQESTEPRSKKITCSNIYIYIYLFYTHIRNVYANGIVKEKTRKRKSDP